MRSMSDAFGDVGLRPGLPCELQGQPVTSLPVILRRARLLPRQENSQATAVPVDCLLTESPALGNLAAWREPALPLQKRDELIPLIIRQPPRALRSHPRSFVSHAVAVHHPADGILAAALHQLQLRNECRAEPVLLHKVSQRVQLTNCPRLQSSAGERAVQPSSLFQPAALVVNRSLAFSRYAKIRQTLLVANDLSDEGLNLFDGPAFSRHAQPP